MRQNAKIAKKRRIPESWGNSEKQTAKGRRRGRYYSLSIPLSPLPLSPLAFFISLCTPFSWFFHAFFFFSFTYCLYAVHGAGLASMWLVSFSFPSFLPLPLLPLSSHLCKAPCLSILCSTISVSIRFYCFTVSF